MKYSDYKKRVPDQLREITIFRGAGIKPHGKAVFGFGLAEQVGEEAIRLGGRNVLLVTHPTITKLGLHEVVVASMKRAGMSCDIFDKVDAEPSVESARTLEEVVRRKGYDLIVGLGGGSALDMAKAAALCTGNREGVDQFLDGTPVTGEGSPLILLPTTAGTGSEISPFIVLKDGDKKRFFGTPYAYATVAMIDPMLTVTMPPRVTAATGLDALTHGVEGAIAKRDAYTEALSGKCTELVFGYLPRAYKDGEDLDARYHMSFASLLGMMAYSQAGGLYAHSISYILTMSHQIPHGIGCGIALPYTLLFNEPHIRPLLVRFAQAINLGTGKIRANGTFVTIRRFHKLLKTLEVPVSLCELGVEKSMKDTFIRELMDIYPRPRNPRKMTCEDADNLFNAMWCGTVRTL
jgi:alcohol dehydrogenase class IV